MRHTISVLVENKFGVLARVAGLFIFLMGVITVNSIHANKSILYADESELVTATKLLYKGEFNTAIEQFNTIITKDSQNAGAHHNLACAYALKEDYDKALAEFEEARKLEETSFKAIILFNESVVYLKKKLYERASEMLNKAVELMPGMDMINDFRGFNSVCIGLAQGSLITEKINLLYYEDSPFLFDTACFVTKQMKKYNLNIYVFNDLNPPPLFFYKSGRALLFWGDSYFCERNTDEAENKFKVALAIKDMNKELDLLTEATANYLLGLVKFRKSYYPEAIEYLKKATELMPNNFGYFRELSFAYLLNHDYFKAKENCEIALKLNPDDEEAKEHFKMINRETDK